MLLRVNSILRVNDMKPSSSSSPSSPEPNTSKTNSFEHVLAKNSQNGQLHLVDVVDFILRARKLSTHASLLSSSCSLSKEPSIPKIVIPTGPSSADHEDIVVSKRRETAAIYRTAPSPQRSLSLTHASYPCRPTAKRRSTINTKSHRPPSPPPSSRPILHGYGTSTDSLAPSASIRLLGPEPYIDLNSSKNTAPPKNRRPSAYSSSSSSSSSSCSSYSIEHNDTTNSHRHKYKASPKKTRHATTLASNTKALPPTPSATSSNLIANTRSLKSRVFQSISDKIVFDNATKMIHRQPSIVKKVKHVVRNTSIKW